MAAAASVTNTTVFSSFLNLPNLHQASASAVTFDIFNATKFIIQTLNFPIHPRSHPNRYAS
ncbi:hypothetical protein R6Q59_000003 [Mikania micrantha]